MKQSNPFTLFGSCLLLTVFVSVLGCQDRVQLQQKETEAAMVEPPKQIISLPQAQAMYRNYTERREPLIRRYEDSINIRRQDSAKFDVARYVHYDYATIKQYLAYIEQEARMAGVDISTLRFYISNYPDQATFEDGRPVKHPRQNSIMILPTLKQDGEDYGFYTMDNASGQRIPVLLTGQLQPYNPDGMGGMSQGSGKNYAGMLPNPLSSPNTAFQGGNSTILNEGTGAPPPHK